MGDIDGGRDGDGPVGGGWWREFCWRRRRKFWRMGGVVSEGGWWGEGGGGDVKVSDTGNEKHGVLCSVVC